MGPTLSYDYRSADYATAAARLGERMYPGLLRLACFAVVLVAMLGGMALGLGVAVALNVAGDNSVFFSFAGLGLGWFVAGRPLVAQVNRWAARRAARSTTIEGQTVSYEFLEDGLRVTTPHSETLLRWSGIDQAFEAQGTIYLVVGLSGYFLPDRAFRSPEARLTTANWILAHLTPEARARSQIGKTSPIS